MKRLVVEPGARLSLQRHRYRAESWIVVSGSPRMIVSGRARRARARDAVAVPRGAWHRIENPGRTRALIIEVQHGPYLGEDDIERREDDYGRAGADPGVNAGARRGSSGGARALPAGRRRGRPFAARPGRPSLSKRPARAGFVDGGPVSTCCPRQVG